MGCRLWGCTESDTTDLAATAAAAAVLREGVKMSDLDHTVVVNQPSFKENNLFLHGDLLGCWSWLRLKSQEMNVACSV